MSTTTQAPTTHFILQKGEKFALNKGIKQVRIGLGWDAGDNLDPDASLIGLVHLPNGNPKFYNATPGKTPSHAVCYANHDIQEKGGPRFIAPDRSIIHSGDDRTGGKGGYEEVISIDFDKLPPEIVELAAWVTIYEAKDRKQNFGSMKNSFIDVNDVTGLVGSDMALQDPSNQGRPLAQYKLREEFAHNTAVQVGSFIKNNDAWEFQALGVGVGNLDPAGDPNQNQVVELGEVLERYS